MGGFRPILDLRIQNLCITRKTFHMLTIRRLLELQTGDWFITIDMKDAYFHVEVALKVPAFCLSGDSLLVQHTIVRLLPSSSHLQQVCGCGATTTVHEWWVVTH